MTDGQRDVVQITDKTSERVLHFILLIKLKDVVVMCEIQYQQKSVK